MLNRDGSSFREACRILDEDEARDFPHVQNFLIEYQAQRCDNDIELAPVNADRVIFFDNSVPKFERCSKQDLKELGAGGTFAAQLFVIQGMDLDWIIWILGSFAHNCTSRRSLLSFLNDFLFDEPTLSFDVPHHQIPLTPSTRSKQQHETFSYVQYREFDRPFYLSYLDVQRAAKASGIWRNRMSCGPSNPMQSIRSDSRRTAFPPIALHRTRASAWFDCRSEEPWKTAIVLTDKTPDFEGLSGKLLSPRHVIKNHISQGHVATHSLLMDCIRRNPNLGKSGVPAPLTVLQDLYSIIGYEWMLLNSFQTRDLNSIDWTLQGGAGLYENESQKLYRIAMRKLFATRRRMTFYRRQVRLQLEFFQAKGKPAWQTSGALQSEAERIGEQVARDLASDFEQIDSTLAMTTENIEQSIRNIMGETTITEAERTNAQSNILLAIAVVGAFFIPISTLAAIFSMSGNWAAGESGFGFFWALCISISIFTMLILVVIMRWAVIKKWVGGFGGPPQRSNSFLV